MAFSPRYRSAGKNSLEPTRVRTDGSRNEGNDFEERLKARVAQNTAYEKYKASLHAYFNGEAPLPDHLREMLATRPGAEAVFGEPDTVEAEPALEPKKKKGKGKGKRAPERDGTERRARRMVSSNGSDYASLVEAVRKAASPRESEQSVDALKAAGHALPLDAEVLSKALGHSNDDVISEALRGLLSIADQVKSPRLLRTRLDNVVLLTRSGEVKGLCEELKARLA